MSMNLHTLKNSLFLLLVTLLLMTLAGCAKKITSNETLEEARTAYQSAEANPDIVRHAPLELRKAEMALGKADKLMKEQGELAAIEHHAYLAKQHVALATEIGNQKIAEMAIARASDERNKVLLEARSAQIDLERAAALEAQAETAAAREQTAAAREKAEKLQQEIAELQAVKADRGLVMTLGDVLFDVNKADLKPGAVHTIGKLADFLNEYPDRRIMIEGFTDSTGSAEYNRALSERRALAVRQALLDRGINSSRMDFKGYGLEFPVATNANAAGRQLNRRVEIIISDGTGTIPGRKY